MDGTSIARSLDQFYTAKPVVLDCLALLHQHLPARPAFFLEPSAGDGAFFDELPRRSRLGLDLAPNHPDVVAQDFLTFDEATLPRGRKVVVVGNPPFGKNSSLALRFVNKAAAFADIVAFVLPKTFKKTSFLNKVDRSLHLAAEIDLPAYAFLFDGAPYDVPCVFQVWKKEVAPRALIPATIAHDDFDFTAPARADFAVRRVGGLAGKVLNRFDGYSPSSHYYIKACINLGLCLGVFQTIDWDQVKYNTAGNPSVSKSEVVALYGRAKASLAEGRDLRAS